MLMDFPNLMSKYNMDVHGLLHVGAHLGEEASIYQSCGIEPVWWVEGNPAVLDFLERHLSSHGQHLIHALVYSEDGVELDFNITNYDGMSSSILEFGTHPQFSPDTVFVDKVRLSSRSIDSLVQQHGIKANFLNMDLQGAELFALKGATDFLKGVDYVLTEVNCKEVYIGCAQVEELDAILHDFDRVTTHWVGDQGWGDALYLRKQ